MFVECIIHVGFVHHVERIFHAMIGGVNDVYKQLELEKGWGDKLKEAGPTCSPVFNFPQIVKLALKICREVIFDQCQ